MNVVSGRRGASGTLVSRNSVCSVSTPSPTGRTIAYRPPPSRTATTSTATAALRSAGIAARPGPAVGVDPRPDNAARGRSPPGSLSFAGKPDTNQSLGDHGPTRPAAPPGG